MHHMRVVSSFVCALVLLLPLSSAAQQAKKPKPAATAVVVIVTNKSGDRLVGADVTVTGPVERHGVTGATGQARFTGLRPGTYRFRFDAEGFASLEREVVVSGGRVNEVRAALAAQPAPVKKPRPEPETPPAPPETPVEPTSLVVEAFLDKNRIKDDEPNQETQIGCTAGSTVVLHQLRDLLENQLHRDADSVVTVLEGEGVLRLGEAHHPLVESMVVVIPRGVSYAIRREGRRPLVVLVTLAGAPCKQ
jgi:mannose-6-phosphate isomerase-like protein (cupin superfamily)